MSEPVFEQIPLTYFSKRTNKTTKLVNNANPEQSMQGKRTWYPLAFVEPVYISTISIAVSGYRDGKTMEFRFETPDARTAKRTTVCSENRFQLDLGMFVSSLQFRPDDYSSVFTDRMISSVEIIGYTRKDFDAFEQAVFKADKTAERLNQERDQLDADKRQLEQDQDSWKSQTETLEQQQAELQKSVTAEQTKLETLISQIESRESSRENLKQQVLDLQKSIETRSEERRNLVADIDERRLELTSIRDEIGLFPSEISEFVKEGKRNIGLYLGLSVPLFLVLIGIAGLLFGDALDLVKIWETNADVRVWDLFLTRLPFVIVAVTVLEVCGYGIGKILSEIFRITRQRLSLSKLGIIAKDVTAAATFDEELTKEERIQFQTELKMQLLREHIKEEVGEEFQYRGTLLHEAAKSIVSRVAPKNN